LTTNHKAHVCTKIRSALVKSKHIWHNEIWSTLTFDTKTLNTAAFITVI
jgi:hypothetical protein